MVFSIVMMIQVFIRDQFADPGMPQGDAEAMIAVRHVPLFPSLPSCFFPRLFLLIFARILDRCLRRTLKRPVRFSLSHDFFVIIHEFLGAFP